MAARTRVRASRNDRMKLRHSPVNGGAEREADMLSGVTVLAVALAVLVAIWIMVLVGSQYFGSPPEH